MQYLLLLQPLTQKQIALCLQSKFWKGQVENL